MYATPESELDVLPAFFGAETIYCPGTAEHSTRVGKICAAMSQALDLDSADVEVMNWVGILHDLGKLALPVEILRKAGPLTELEWIQVKRHSVVGSELILAVSPHLKPLAQAIRAHHERWDGSGYPDATDRFDIPLFGRIAAIADVFDAITHQRGYRAGQLNDREGVEFVKQRANRHFDPELVKVFVDLDRRGMLALSAPNLRTLA
jgi:HD-GYP domain-containing protein (c-di-GMP phosphodiesterase class II)